MASQVEPSTAVPAVAPTARARNSPFLPTPTEIIILLAYPALLVFGTLFSLLSPETRAAPYDTHTQAHTQDPALAPSYFARKDNLLNVLFVKKGWAWISGVFVLFLVTHPALISTRKKIEAATRWALVTAWWILITQWCFGPAIIDRGFRYTGGKCEAIEGKVAAGEGATADVWSAVACKAGGGRWSGGHDISGHVFLLVLGSVFLLQEVGWVVRRWTVKEERRVVMHDGAVKNAEVESERAQDGTGRSVLGIGGRVAAGVVVLSWWMILMTAIYFHTWVEKLAGLLVALVALYAVYILPRWIPVLRAVIGLPGI